MQLDETSFTSTSSICSMWMGMLLRNLWIFYNSFYTFCNSSMIILYFELLFHNYSSFLLAVNRKIPYIFAKEFIHSLGIDFNLIKRYTLFSTTEPRDDHFSFCISLELLVIFSGWKVFLKKDKILSFHRTQTYSKIFCYRD